MYLLWFHAPFVPYFFPEILRSRKNANIRLVSDSVERGWLEDEVHGIGKKKNNVAFIIVTLIMITALTSQDRD